MFKSCTGFKIQALCIGSKKNMTKNRAQQEKKLRKFQEHCVQKCLFQGFDKHKKIQEQLKKIKEFKCKSPPCFRVYGKHLGAILNFNRF